MADQNPDDGAKIMTASALNAIGGVLSLLNPEQMSLIGGFIGEILRPIVKQEIDDAFKRFGKSSEVSGQNEKLQNLWGASESSTD